ncbi:MAG: hypothetical protein GC181_09430 [Bacteroidetes bacterium]|nr:hypothetical protein [Bacteroidota bacterium]
MMKRIKYLKKFLAIPLVVLFMHSFTTDNGFRDSQLKNQRVQMAFKEKLVDVNTMLGLKGIDQTNFEIYIRAFKMEQVVEVWGRTRGANTWCNVVNYNFCSTVGQLGPKRKEGDYQIPEGFYTVSEFNPNSDFLLSLKLNYPNKSDSILGVKGKLGDLIYIHGGCMTIGCIPITDDKIEELYVLSVIAKDQGQNQIPIHIFPARLNYGNYNMLAKQTTNKSNVRFWGNLRTCYTYFEENGILPEISVNEKGDYVYKRSE